MDVTTIEIKAHDNGGHNNNTLCGQKNIRVPEGWAYFPDTVDRTNFPFGSDNAEEIDGIMTVTNWELLPIPESEPETVVPTQLDRVEAQATYTAMMTDTLLEV